MRKAILVVIACALSLGWAAGPAAAGPIPLTIGDPHYVGSITDGIPSSEAWETEYINNLIVLAAGAGNTTIGDEVYNRQGSALTGLPTALEAGAIKIEGDDLPYTGIDMSGFTYILGKYDAANAGSLVWIIRDVNFVDWDGTVDLPSHYNGHGLSHYTRFNPVPDGGTTLMLLGGALLGVGLLRRKLGA